MPQLLVLVVVGTAAYVGYRYLKNALEGQGQLQEARIRVNATQLVRGPDGIYRPVSNR